MSTFFRSYNAVLSILFVSALTVSQTQAAAPIRSPLHGWYSPSRGDNFATSQENWAGRPSDTRPPDYQYVRLEGYVLRDPAPGTVPLYLWYSPSRGDNFATTAWPGGPGDTRAPDYEFVGVEGHVFEDPVSGTIPLYSWYSPSRGDNFLTTHASWVGEAGDAREPDYRLSGVEGYVFPPDDFGGIDPSLGFGYERTPIVGSRPVFLIIVDFSDVPLAFDESFIEREVFGPQEPNLLGMFRNASGGTFTFTRGGVARVRLGPSAVALPRFDETLLLWAADLGGADFSSFAGSDGLLTSNELAVLVVTSAYDPGGGQTRPIPTTRVSGIVTSNLLVSFCNEYGDINLKAHELFHQLGQVQHIYGPRFEVNFSASFFAGGQGNDPRNPRIRPFLLDPWHRMVTGWMEPRVMRLTDAAWSTVITSFDRRGSSAPILLWDPEHSRDEFFLIEYRNPRASGLNYDSGCRSQGVAVWLVKRNPSGALALMAWPPPGYSGRSGQIFAHYLIGPSGAGTTPFWTEGDGEASFLWSDGSDSGVRLRVGALDWESTVARVQVGREGHCFIPRIDCVTPTELDAAGRIVIDGSFPASQADTVVRLRQGSSTVTLEPYSHNTTRLVVDIPTSVGAGTYFLSVASVPGSSCESNAVEVYVGASAPQRVFQRGDASGDGTLNLSDGVQILEFLFRGRDLSCLDAADADDSGRIELTDAVTVFRYLFSGGTTIRGAGRCAPDATGDALECVVQEACRD